MRERKRAPGSPQSAYCRAQFCVLLLRALLSLGTATSIWAQASVSVEYQLKAAFLYNFAKFVEWPLDALPNDNSPITLCVFRHDPFGTALDEVVRGKTINSREVLARRITELADLKSCQLLFVSVKEARHVPEILNTLKGASVLVVGESESFAESGGAIQFFQSDGRLRFAINLDALQRARLIVSSKLLALAKIVHDKDHPTGSY